MNLVGNAVKFTDTGSVMLEMEEGPTPGKSLLFKVIDTGAGIPKAATEKLFDSFSQADASITRKYGGTGLGLAISKRIVEAMGGEISVESEVGKGSTFAFDVHMEKTGESEWNKIDNHHEAFNGLHLLIVDDIKTNREIFQRTLESWGAKVSIAANARQGLTVLEKTIDNIDTPDLIIVDYAMPDQNGLDFLETIRQDLRFSNIPAILASSIYLGEISSDLRDKLKISSTHMKPVRQSTLYNSIIDAISSSKGLKFQPKPVDEKLTNEERDKPLYSNVRALIAEDNHINQQVAERVLNRLGIHTDVVGNGQEATKSVRDYPYDIVFMDVQMPVMDGLQATEEIRKNNKEIPIIAITANALKEDAQRCIDAGMDAHIPKPFKRQQIIKVLDEFLNQKPAGNYSI
jgi:CheY-like chemotaxis protein